MAPPDGQKNAADGLFMSGACTVAGTFFLLSDCYQGKKSGCFYRSEEPKRLTGAAFNGKDWREGHPGTNYIQSCPIILLTPTFLPLKRKFLSFMGKKKKKVENCLILCFLEALKQHLKSYHSLVGQEKDMEMKICPFVILHSRMFMRCFD